MQEQSCPKDDKEPRRCQRQRAQPVKYDEQFETSLKIKKRKQKQKAKFLERTSSDEGVEEQNVQKPKRTKERLVQEIIEKVSTWRSLYNGIQISSEVDPALKTVKKLTLEEAAIEVGITKKSLDDYLL